MADFEADDRYDPFVVEYSFAKTASQGHTKYTAVSGGSYFITISGLTDTNGDCSLIGSEDSMGWVDIIGYVGPYADGGNYCGVYLQVSHAIPDRT